MGGSGMRGIWYQIPRIPDEPQDARSSPELAGGSGLSSLPPNLGWQAGKPAADLSAFIFDVA